jgi:HAD superfamily phosphoserine phosphatase-like hydrolase
MDSYAIGKSQYNYGGVMQLLSIFDMDKTITRGATFSKFLRHSLTRHNRWRLLLLPAVVPVTAAYGLRLINRSRLKATNLRLLAGRGDYEGRAGSFALRTLARNVLPAARAQIEADHADGARLVMATASYNFYAGEIGRALGFDDVIATMNEGARVVGENCYGDAKLRMIETWMASEGIDRDKVHIRFYSDHVSDAPCLEWADEAFAVNPHRPLRRLAAANGWTVLDWAKAPSR